MVDCVSVAIAGLLNIGEQVFNGLCKQLDLQYQIVRKYWKPNSF